MSNVHQVAMKKSEELKIFSSNPLFACRGSTKDDSFATAEKATMPVKMMLILALTVTCMAISIVGFVAVIRAASLFMCQSLINVFRHRNIAQMSFLLESYCSVQMMRRGR